MTNLRAPPSRASSTFCLSSWRLPTISCPSTPTTTTPRLSFCRLKLMSAPPQSAAEAAARHRLLKQNHRQLTGRGRAALKDSLTVASLLALSRRVGLQYGHRRRVHNIVGAGAARQVGDRSRQALQDGPDRLPAPQTLHQFVSDVAAVKIGEHEHVGVACHRRSGGLATDRKSTRLNSSHSQISYAVFCLKKKKQQKSKISTGD